MKLRRIFAVCFALFLVAGVLFACGNGGENGEDNYGETITTNNNNIALEDERLQDPTNYPRITITMEDGGVIEAVLYPNQAPNTVANFIYLVQQGYFDGLNFHRGVPGFMLQGGAGDSARNIPCETAGQGVANNIAHVPGVLSMAHAGPNTGSSQFFIMTGDAPWLDGLHTGFGMVTSGLDVVERMIEAPRTGANNDQIITPPVIASITVDTRGIDYPDPVFVS